MQPLFPVPSCVLFAGVHDASAAVSLPERVQAFTGTLPRRNAGAPEADAHLSVAPAPWPAEASSLPESPYRRLFRNGATLVPRRLILVEPAPVPGMLPPNPEFPMIRGRTGTQDKAPWKTVEPPQGRIKKDFLYSVLLGESIAPFRVLTPQQAVIPWDMEGHGTNLDLDINTGVAPKQQLMDSRTAGERGHLELAQWLEKVEALWERHKRSPISFLEQCDYYGKLSCQFPTAAIRVVYTKAGTNLAACVVRKSSAIIDHIVFFVCMSGLSIVTLRHESLLN